MLKIDCKYPLMNRRAFFSSLIAYATTIGISRAKINCKLTPNQPMGPFFKNNITNSSDLTNNNKAFGKTIGIKGKVLNTNCKPHPLSEIYIWQANAFGKYNHQKDLSQNNNDKNFNGYAKITSDKDGVYSFKTIIPGSYKVGNNIIRPPHIHFFVKTKQSKKLITQLYFKNHPYNKTDFLYRNVNYKNLIELNLKNITDNYAEGIFNIII